MIYGIMKSHDGVITVYSEEGKGTVFNLYFPAVVKNDPNESAIQEKASQNISLKQGILVVDDEESMRELAGDILGSCGANIHYASDGQEAIDKYKSHQNEIDLILLDIIMPKLDGINAFKKLRGN